VNAKERVEWLKAVRACFPEHDTRGVAAAAQALEGPGRWEVSVRGGGLHVIGLRFFGSGPYAPWREACARAFSLGGAALPTAPREGFPWLTAAWDLRTGDWTALRLTGADGSKLKAGRALAWDFKRGEPTPAIVAVDPKPFKPGVFKEPALDAALADFAALCPIGSMAIEDGGWSLRLAQGLRWPLFARCDLSAAFTPDSSQLALFLLDRRVTELSFDGDALWAHCRG
jgi:hypothetical protein